MFLRSQKIVSLKATVRITTGLIKVVFGNSIIQYYKNSKFVVSYHVMPPLGRRAGPSPGHCLLSAGTSMDRATSKIRVGEKRMGG
jgi:hypothetical protein